MNAAETKLNPVRIRARGALAPVLLALGLAACSTTPRVQTQVDAAVDFSRYRTFALLPLPSAAPGVAASAMPALARAAEETLRAELARKGFSEVPRDRADFAVSVLGASLPRTEVVDYGYTRHIYTRTGDRIQVHEGERAARRYDERMLTVEMFDNRSRKTSWSGSVSRSAQGAIRPEGVQEGIREILAGFPPAPKGR